MSVAIFVLLGLISDGKPSPGCTEPPVKYGVLGLQDCHKDPKTGNVGCTYGLCMRDPTGQAWCGAMLLMRETCKGLFKPALIELAPVDQPVLPKKDTEAKKKTEVKEYDL